MTTSASDFQDAVLRLLRDCDMVSEETADSDDHDRLITEAHEAISLLHHDRQRYEQALVVIAGIGDAIAPGKNSLGRAMADKARLTLGSPRG